MYEENSNSVVVLVIDDENSVRQSTKNYLEDLSYNILEADDGKKGLEIFEREKPDIVLVDLRMPQVDGLDVLSHIVKSSPETPVIILSGTGVIGDAVEALRRGAWNYLLKPIEDLSVLQMAIEKALERARLIQENRIYQLHLEEEVNRRTRELEETTQYLRESEEKYRSIFENLQDVYCEISPDGTIDEISPSIESISHYTREEILYSNLWNICTDKETAEVLTKKLKKQSGVTDYEFGLTDKDGRILFCSITARLHVDSNGNPSKIVGTIRDISERKHSEEEKRRLTEQLHQVQKIEAIGSLTGGIAHDFNNILTVINGHAEIALKRIEKNQPMIKDINAILQAGRRAANLTRQLLAFSRKQIFKPKVIDINDVIKELEQMLRRLIGEDIRMDVHFCPGIPSIKADPTQIEQILINLIVNARDAIVEDTNPSAEKIIAIQTEQVLLDNTFVMEHPGSNPGIHTILSVTDTGIGMDAETQKRVFEPFFTTKEKGKGTGLGMSTVYGIVKQNNGSIYVYSETGHGTTFKIYWPSTEESVIPDITEKQPAPEITGTETILLVEDDDSVRFFTAETLRNFGYKVFEASNGKKALDFFENNKPHIDLLLTDLVMPEMNGMDLAERVKKIAPRTLTLYASGYTDSHIIHRYELDENIQFIQKPFSVQALASKVRDTLDKKVQHG